MTTKKLPITDFISALNDFKAMVYPLINDNEREELNKIISRFIDETGAMLSKKLEAYFNALSGNQNWMAPFWKQMYLSIREPLYLDSNYSFHLSDIEGAESLDQCVFMADWIRQVAQFYLSLKTQPVEYHTQSGRLQCVINARNIFGQYREPAQGVDEWLTFDDTIMTRVGIQCNNRFYSIKVIDSQYQVISQAALIKQLSAVMDAGKLFSGDRLFTAGSSQGSDIAAQLLKELLEDPENKRSYEALSSCICHFTILDEDFKRPEQVCEQTYLRDKSALWPYIPVNFVMWRNNRMSVFAEHTGADASSLLYSINAIKAQCINVEGASIHETKMHNFRYSKEINQRLAYYLQCYQKTVRSFECYACDIDILPQYCSSDTIAQLMFQFGMYEAEQQIHSIYSPSTMDHFREGRTEALRSVSSDSIRFIETLASGIFDDDAFKKAVATYKARIKNAKMAKGSTRYLSGLKWMAEDNEDIGYFYDSVAYKKLNSNYLSTSNLGCPGETADYFFFAPPTGSRIGIGYLTNKSKIRLCLTYKKHDADYVDRMLDAFHVFKTWFN